MMVADIHIFLQKLWLAQCISRPPSYQSYLLDCSAQTHVWEPASSLPSASMAMTLLFTTSCCFFYMLADKKRKKKMIMLSRHVQSAKTHRSFYVVSIPVRERKRNQMRVGECKSCVASLASARDRRENTIHQTGFRYGVITSPSIHDRQSVLPSDRNDRATSSEERKEKPGESGIMWGKW